jgi:hypothetical protein
MKMKHTFLFLSLILSFTMAMTCFSTAEAATTKKASSKTKSKKNTGQKTTSKSRLNQDPPKDITVDVAPIKMETPQFDLPTLQGTYCSDGRKMDEGVIGQCDWGFDTNTCNCKENPNTNANTNNVAKKTVQGCATKFQQMYDVCETDVTTASQSCDNDQDSDIQSAKGQLSEFAVGIGNQVSVSAPCAGIAKYVGAMNAAVAGFAAICSSKRNACLGTCKKAAKAIGALSAEQCGMTETAFAKFEQKTKEQLSTCDQLSGKVDLAQGAVQNILGTVKGAQNCAKQVLPADYCRANPTALGCSNGPVECANPTYAAQNPICFCSGPDAATNPRCRGAVRASNNELSSGMPTLSGGSSSEANPVFDSSKEEWKGNTEYKPSTGGGDDPGGKKGGRPMDGGGGSGHGGGAAGAGGPGDPAPGVVVNNGFRGGSGSGGGSMNGHFDEREAKERAAGGAAGAGNEGPDLRQFLPGGKFDPGARGVAGMTGPDGITGPHDNLWRKVKNRYQAQQSTFLGQ